MASRRSSSSDSLTDASLQSMDVESVLSLERSPEPDEKQTDDSTTNSPLRDGLTDSAETMSDGPDKPRLLGEDEDIDDTSAIRVAHHLDDDDDDDITPYSKRKRASINYNLDDLKYNGLSRNTPLGERAPKRPKKSPEVRGVIIGVWRDSSLEDDKDKHVIFGFIDIHDRLRTRIYPMNRRGEECIANIPTGAGGCWVTFPRVIFDSHLASLSPAEVKEYVKLRVTAPPESSDEEREKADLKAAQDAVIIVAAQDASPAGRPTGPPRGPRKSTEGYKTSLTRTPSYKAANSPGGSMQPPKGSPAVETTKPNGVLLGYWADSDELRLEDKHAVYGVVGGSDCFRVKVTRTTRDGRFMEGNFPTGAGALWLHYDQVVLDDHLAPLSRAEVKEYVRIRQRDADKDEPEKERKANNLQAVQEAIAIVAAHGSSDTHEPSRRASPELEVRHSARSEQRLAARQQAEAEAKALKDSERIRQEKAEARERQHEQTRKEVAIAEASIKGAAQMELQNNLKKLNKVWQQQQMVIGSPAPVAIGGPIATTDDLKFYQGIKYERKNTGPFQGKLASPAQLINIDGEDYVEYRILTKPSFF
ncbi:hypothetical protein BP6252_09709 [Coleophoma cylindrospora]|uniref:Uncharacterized protein n=1 Tax=Coleophoma cylindrospora TaxID=1849047 RepID=A0A3D8QX03_9HELO|nr:hypothetical protein BP6252_09709 [Coleophoma cylindrospora]